MFCLSDLAIGESQVLMLPAIIVLGYISSFVSTRFCFLKLHVHMFGENIFLIVLTS
jgi:hypothetical protein